MLNWTSMSSIIEEYELHACDDIYLLISRIGGMLEFSTFPDSDAKDSYLPSRYC